MEVEPTNISCSVDESEANCYPIKDFSPVFFMFIRRELLTTRE